MSVAWHSSLTLAEDHKIENIQKTSLKIILGESYIDYPSSLTRTGLASLSERGKSQCLAFAKRCLSDPQTKEMFPLTPESSLNLRKPEKYMVNFARTENRTVLYHSARGFWIKQIAGGGKEEGEEGVSQEAPWQRKGRGLGQEEGCLILPDITSLYDMLYYN